MKIYTNSKFPRTKRVYDKASSENVEKLKDIMSKLVIKDEKPEPVAQYKPPSGGSLLSYGSTKKRDRRSPDGSFAPRQKKPATFALK